MAPPPGLGLPLLQGPLQFLRLIPHSSPGPHRNLPNSLFTRPRKCFAGIYILQAQPLRWFSKCFQISLPQALAKC